MWKSCQKKVFLLYLFFSPVQNLCACEQIYSVDLCTWATERNLNIWKFGFHQKFVKATENKKPALCHRKVYASAFEGFLYL